MTDEVGFAPNNFELFRWDKDGKLVYVHPTLLEKVNELVDVRMAELVARFDALEKRVDNLVKHRFEELRLVPHPCSKVPFGSAEKLVETIAANFHCLQGDQRSHHSVWRPGHLAYDAYPYVVLGAIAPDTIPDAQEYLRQVIWTALHKLRRTCKSGMPVLYWRRTVEESTSEPKDGKLRHRISVRLAIPEADFSVVSELIPQVDGTYVTLKG